MGGKLVEKLGIKHVSTSPVSQKAKTLDDQIEAFHTSGFESAPELLSRMSGSCPATAFSRQAVQPVPSDLA